MPIHSRNQTNTVLITGASTGIGKACALHLDRLGWQVFAGVRREADGEALRKESVGSLVPLMLDVTSASSIGAAADLLNQSLQGKGLNGLVNNAGIAVAGPLEFLPVEQLRTQLEVNVIGAVAVTQAFLPSLRKCQGRIVNMGSIGGRMASPLLGPYNASKFALEALTDALRMELASWGIEVSIIEPGDIQTPIWQKSSTAAQQIIQTFPPHAHQLYGKLMAAVSGAASRAGESGIPPLQVAKAVAHALTARNPKTRYLVGKDARLRALLVKLLQDRWLDKLILKKLNSLVQ